MSGVTYLARPGGWIRALRMRAISDGVADAIDGVHRAECPDLGWAARALTGGQAPAAAGLPGEGFRIETTTVDGRGHALLCCVACSWYGMHISSRIGGAVTRWFRYENLDALLAAAAGHDCPLEVRTALYWRYYQQGYRDYLEAAERNELAAAAGRSW